MSNETQSAWKLLTNVIYLKLSRCPIDNISPNIQRLLDRIETRYRELGDEHNDEHNCVYTATQSVHNHMIQTHIKTLRVLNLTFDEMLQYVWRLVDSSEHKEELIRIMDQEM